MRPLDAAQIARLQFHRDGATANPETVTGTINMTMSMAGGHPMHVKRTIQGKWMGADCGSVKAAGG